jgi:hypothetical protein
MTRIALLLADRSPLLRLHVLRHILGRLEDDAEVGELRQLALADPLIQDIVCRQQPDGSWSKQSIDDSAASTDVLATALSLMRLGYLGLDSTVTVIQRGVAYLFDQQLVDGSWPLPITAAENVDRKTHAARDTYKMVPLQTALPLRALAACGYATDPRAERAYHWLLDKRLPDGAWPTGLAADGVNGFVAGYRKMPHSRWGCRSNTTAALICLALHPERRHDEAAYRALDLLLGRETHDEFALGYEVARMIGIEPAHGFFTFHARYDLALVLRLCGLVGVSRDDGRVNALVDYLKNLQGASGLWEYRRNQQVNRWLTCDLLQSFAMLEGSDSQDAWISLEPRTPFQAYPRKQKRY